MSHGHKRRFDATKCQVKYVYHSVYEALEVTSRIQCILLFTHRCMY